MPGIPVFVRMLAFDVLHHPHEFGARQIERKVGRGDRPFETAAAPDQRDRLPQSAVLSGCTGHKPTKPV
jgi:hypothetical protein